MASSKRPREPTTNSSHGTPDQPSAARRKLTNIPSIVIVPNGGENPSASGVEWSYLVGERSVVKYPPSDVSPVIASTFLDTPHRDVLSPFQGVADENQRKWSLIGE